MCVIYARVLKCNKLYYLNTKIRTKCVFHSISVRNDFVANDYYDFFSFRSFISFLIKKYACPKRLTAGLALTLFFCLFNFISLLFYLFLNRLIKWVSSRFPGKLITPSAIALCKIHNNVRFKI